MKTACVYGTWVRTRTTLTANRAMVRLQVRLHHEGRTPREVYAYMTTDETRELIAELTDALARTEGPADA